MAQRQKNYVANSYKPRTEELKSKQVKTEFHKQSDNMQLWEKVTFL